MPKGLTQENLGIPTIAIIGRVNVGKSTLFNKLIGETKAIVSTIGGTTRTTNEGLLHWRGRHIRVLDTGGLSFEEDTPFEEDILVQSEKAMKLADVILFITDGQVGVMPQERELAKRMRKISHKPVIFIANKVDNKRIEASLTEPDWYKLGLGEPFPISAASGRSIGDLLDKIFEVLGDEATDAEKFVEEDPGIRISLIGKPNVGKSSLFNRIIGEERVIVSDIAHTTREPHDTTLEYRYKQGEEEIMQKITFKDTAGIRRKSRVSGFLERMGIAKSITSIDDSDIILFVIDGSETISQQDMQLAGLIEKRSKSVIILVNKWDLTEDNTEQQQIKVKKMLYSYFPHLSFAQMLLVSGKTGQHVQKILPHIMHAWQARHTHIANRGLEKFLEQATKEHRPSRGKGTRHPKLLGMRQLRDNPPIFEVFVKHRTSLHRSYINYLENKLRDSFDFFATPIVIKLTKTKR
ncbi:MAG: ribosome biogenesis GTPase Der [Candidatus Magasanikbacteria bacterium]|nr:ribosome biogenesis GTPase Der [Candidatus Magasanikbacteria bacterium]